VIELHYEYAYPTVSAAFSTMKPYFDGVAEATNGQVEVIYHTGGSMGPGEEIPDHLISGLSSAGLVNLSSHVGVFPLWEVYWMPLNVPSATIFSEVVIDMVGQGWHDEEFAKAGFKTLYAYSNGPYVWFSADPIDSFLDWNGIVSQCPDFFADAMKELGVAVVDYNPGECYLALQKNIIDGCWFPWDASHAFGLGEVSSQVYESWSFTSAKNHIIALDYYNNVLPQSARDYFEDVDIAVGSARAEAGEYDRIADQDRADFLALGGGREVKNLWEMNDVELFETATGNLWQTKVNSLRALGLPADDFLKALWDSMDAKGISDPKGYGYSPY
jgi:TRAP-type C4-dicarboxylate transport system substrate-binding protein